jgi:hypothetical protein
MDDSLITNSLRCGEPFPAFAACKAAAPVIVGGGQAWSRLMLWKISFAVV